MTGMIIPKEHMTMFRLGVLRSALTVTQVNTRHLALVFIRLSRARIPAAFLDSKHSVPCGLQDSVG